MSTSNTPPSNITSDPSSPPPANTAPKVHHGVINKSIANFIGDAATFLHTALTDGEITHALADRGYDAPGLTAIEDQIENAAAACGVRLEKAGVKLDAHDDLMSAEDTARESYAAFREIMRAAFPAQGDRVALGLTGDVPTDLQRFIDLAHTSYTNAAKSPWSAKATLRGYPAAKLTPLDAQLTSLTTTDSTTAVAAGTAQESTAARDQLVKALRATMKELRGVCRGAFRQNPGALTKLKL